MRILSGLCIGCLAFSKIFGADPVQTQLEQLYAEYKTISANPTVEDYVSLDKKLRHFTANLPRPENYHDYDKYNHAESFALGLQTGKYNPMLQYSGKFLVLAHQIDPNSPFRKYTLYSQIFGLRSHHGLGEMPNIKVAGQYKNEFPDGPFISEVYLIIANFHKDLYMVIRDLNDAKTKNYKYDCFRHYVEHRPYAEQMEQNRNLALQYYNQFKELIVNSQHERIDEFMDKLKAGTINAWSYCAD